MNFLTAWDFDKLSLTELVEVYDLVHIQHLPVSRPYRHGRTFRWELSVTVIIKYLDFNRTTRLFYYFDS